MNCPQCQRPGLRQIVSLLVDAPADCRALDKQALRQRTIEIEGADWDGATLYCPSCKWMQKLREPAGDTELMFWALSHGWTVHAATITEEEAGEAVEGWHWYTPAGVQYSIGGAWEDGPVIGDMAREEMIRQREGQR